MLFPFYSSLYGDMQQTGLTTECRDQKVAISCFVPGKSSCEIFTEIRELHQLHVSGKGDISVNLA